MKSSENRFLRIAFLFPTLYISHFQKQNFRVLKKKSYFRVIRTVSFVNHFESTYNYILHMTENKKYSYCWYTGVITIDSL